MLPVCCTWFSKAKGITGDVWVSSTGNDLTGDGTSNNPVKTITHALEIIAPSAENPRTIYLDEDIYSTSSTGEVFPITLISHTNIIGAGEGLTKIDDEGSGGVMVTSPYLH